jgi:integrase/recombinase XerD
LPRDPFLSATRRYLDDLRPYRAALTLEQLRRDLRTTARDLWHLRREGNVANVRPEAMKEEDVGALLLYWRTRPTRYGRPMDPTSQAHLFRALKGFLEWCGNGTISRMKARGHVRFPRAIEKPIEVLDSEDLRRLREGADRIDGWNGSVARFLAVFLSATGLRPKEIRLARLRDLELAKGRILVSHPKGEGSWAAADYAPILSFAREAVLDFLVEREAYLRGEPCEALIPYRRVSGEIGPWSEAMLRKLKARMERESGVRFHLRTLRPTFAQTAKDARVSIEAVSRALRHGSTRTTEAYYARIRGEDAFREIERAFERPVVKLEPESR